MSYLSAAGSTTRERTTDIRARLARRKALKPLLRDLLVRDPYNLPAELLPHILTWVGYDLIHNFPGEYYYQTDQLWDPDPGRPERESDSESESGHNASGIELTLVAIFPRKVVDQVVADPRQDVR